MRKVIQKVIDLLEDPQEEWTEKDYTLDHKKSKIRVWLPCSYAHFGSLYAPVKIELKADEWAVFRDAIDKAKENILLRHLK